MRWGARWARRLIEDGVCDECAIKIAPAGVGANSFAHSMPEHAKKGAIKFAPAGVTVLRLSPAPGARRGVWSRRRAWRIFRQ